MKMKVTGYSVRTYGVGTNPSGGRYIEVNGRKIYERLTSNKNGIPTDGGKNPKFVELEEWVKAEFGDTQSVWDWAKKAHKEYVMDQKEKEMKEIEAWIEKIRANPTKFEAWENSYSFGVILDIIPARTLGDLVIESEKALKLEVREGEVYLYVGPVFRKFMKPLPVGEFLEAWDSGEIYLDKNKIRFKEKSRA